MLQRLLLFGTLVGTLMTASPAHALIELKAGYSQFTSTPTDLNNQFPLAPKIEQLQGLNVDVMANVPLMPVGLGVRYEMLKRAESNGINTSQVDWKRTSILVNKRYIDTMMYLGPIATVSVASDFKYESTVGGIATNYKTESTLTATAGVEAGFKMTLLRAGVEAGYMYAPMGELKTSAGVPVTDASGTKVTFNMSGPYARATVGFGF